MQRFDPYRLHLSVLAVAIAACSPAVQAQTVDVSSDALGLASPIRPDTASSNESQRPTETASVAEHPANTASTTSRNDAAGRGAPAADAPESGVKTLDAMQVTGVRRANAAAVESKRAATNITDVISATDVRALPDSTIVEALRRVPGLSVLPATDNEHPRDEAATPVLRGLGPSYNNVTIDGLTIASPGTPNGTLGSITRGVRLDLLPASMVSELQVVKTFTPDLDPNATGGAINLKTRSAFENGGKPFFSAEAALGHANDVGKPRDQDDPGYRLNATG
ncbi:TonB-dependent receptor plug domain-containing protein, partial [Xanthomonas citri]